MPGEMLARRRFVQQKYSIAALVFYSGFLVCRDICVVHGSHVEALVTCYLNKLCWSPYITIMVLGTFDTCKLGIWSIILLHSWGIMLVHSWRMMLVRALLLTMQAGVVCSAWSRWCAVHQACWCKELCRGSAVGGFWG